MDRFPGLTRAVSVFARACVCEVCVCMRAFGVLVLTQGCWFDVVWMVLLEIG